MEIIVSWLKLTNRRKILVEIVRTLLLTFSCRPLTAALVMNFDVIINEVVLFASRIILNIAKLKGFKGQQFRKIAKFKSRKMRAS